MTSRYSYPHKGKQGSKTETTCRRLIIKRMCFIAIFLLIFLTTVDRREFRRAWSQKVDSVNFKSDPQNSTLKTPRNLNTELTANRDLESLNLRYVNSHDLSPIYDNTEPRYSALDFQSRYQSKSNHDVSSRTLEANLQPIRTWKTELLRSLQSLPKLVVQSPLLYRNSLKRSPSVGRLVKLAFDFVEQSDKSYKIVDLDRAQALLDSAIELLIQARYTLIDPKKVAILYLRRAVVAVEQKQFLLAAMNFREALLLSPDLRLKKGFDSAMTLEIFENTLKQLQRLNPYELIKLAERREWIDDRQISLITIKLKDRYFASIWQISKSMTLKLESKFAKSMLVREELNLSKDESVDQGMTRLASQIWHNLPFKVKVQPAKLSQPWQILSGWGLSTPINSPVSAIAFPGVVIETNVQAFRQLRLKWGGSFANSIQDTARDLRENFSIAQAYFGPLWSKVKSHWWFSLGVMIEWTYLGSTKLTRSVGCKFFDLTSEVPTEICNPGRDIREIKSSWRLGPRLQMSFGLQLVKPLSIALQLNASSSLYEQNKHPFTWPIGMAILIGYSFNYR